MEKRYYGNRGQHSAHHPHAVSKVSAISYCDVYLFSSFRLTFLFNLVIILSVILSVLAK